MLKRYEVKNPFYLRGDVQNAGDQVELTDEEVEILLPKDVLGKEVSAGKEKTAKKSE